MPATRKTSGSQFDATLTQRKQPTSKSGTEATTLKSRLAKSKDPDFRATTLYLRKKTLADCEHRLKTTDDPRDMSELVEELMTTWLRGAKA
jgi:hypothetical protein